MKLDSLDRQPVLVAIAGPNGAGKSTFFEQFIRPSGLRFVNADILSQESGLGAYEAAEMAERLRGELIGRRESFVFETVLSDPVGEKVTRLRQVAADGYQVVLCFIGLDSALESDARVALRVTRGGHDVPTEKLMARYPRTLANLALALRTLAHVLVYDNSNLADPYHLVAEYREGTQVRGGGLPPEWFRALANQE